MNHLVLIQGAVDSGVRERSAARNAIVECYHGILPRVQRKLAFDSHSHARAATVSRKEGRFP